MTKKAILIVSMLILALTLPALLHAYETERVIVVVIDGLRNEEAFDDPTHQHIPFIWNVLRPEGTIYTEFYNDFLTTYTTPAHEAIVTGQWHFHPNLAAESVFTDERPEAPTMFEYYRRHTGLPRESCMVVTGKTNNYRLDWGLEPTYGPDFGSLMYVGGKDDQTYDLLADKLAEHTPDLVLVNFKEVDEEGHTADWERYTASIENADHLIYRLWTELIQGNAYYRNKTTLIVTSDHGRNEDAVGFQYHGGLSHANRHVLFLALGPDTRSGRTVSERRYLIDIAPTVGELLQVPTPYAHGQVMTGIFRGLLNPDSRVRVYRKNPRVAAFNGSAYVVWSQNDPDDMGNERIYMKYRHLGETAFADPVLVNDPSEARWAFYPDVSADENGVHVVWLDGRALDGVNDTWSIYYRKSPDWGITWEEEKLIMTSTFASPGDPGTLEIVGEPEIMTTRFTQQIVTVGYQFLGTEKNLLCFLSTDAGDSWREYGINEQNPLPSQYTPLVLSGTQKAVVWKDMAPVSGMDGYYQSEIFFKSTVTSGITWQNFNRLSDNADYSDSPDLAWSGNRVAAAWAERDLSGGLWTIHFRSSRNRGRTWGSTEVLTTDLSVWKPGIVWNAKLSEYNLIFNGVDDDFPNLYISRSSDLEDWSTPVPFTIDGSSGYRSNPQMVYSANSLVIAWEEMDPTRGDWRINTHTIVGF